jgi:hypothetical protein
MAVFSSDVVNIDLSINGNSAVAELNKQQREIAELTNALKELKKAKQQESAEYKQAEAQLEKVTAAMEENRKAMGLQGMTVQQLKKYYADLQKEINTKLIPGTEEYIKKSEQLSKVGDRLEQIRQGGQKVASAMDKLREKFTFNVDIVNALDKVIGKAQALASEVDKDARAFIDLRNEVERTTQATGERLDNLSVSVAAISKTFDQDFNEVLASGNALSREFGENFEKSFATIKDSLSNVSAIQRGEILEQMKEYSVQAKAAGLTIDQFAGVLVNASNQGVFSDKGIDVVKEFGLRIREQTSATRDALSNAFGKQFTDGLFNELNKGSITSVQALERIAQKLNTTGLTAQQTQTIIADVFGGPGEDAGEKYIKSLGNITQGITGVTKNTSELVKQQVAKFKLEEQLADVQNELAKDYKAVASSIDTATKKVQIWTYQGLINAIKYTRELSVWLYENRNALIPLTIALVAFNAQLLLSRGYALAAATAQGIWTAVTRGVTIAQQALNLALKANPIGFVIGLIASLASGLMIAYNNSVQFRAVIQGIWGVLSNLGTIINSAIQDIKNFDLSFSRAGKNIAKSFNEGYKAEYDKGIKERTEQKAKEAEEKKQQAEAEKEAAKAQAQQMNQQQLEEFKKAQEALLQKLKEYKDKKLELEKTLQDLRVSLIRDGQTKELAEVELNHTRQLEAVQKQYQEARALGVASKAELAQLKQQEAEQIALLEDQKYLKIQEINEKYRAQNRQKEAEERQKNLDGALNFIDELQGREMEKMEQNYLQKEILLQEQQLREGEQSAALFEQTLALENEKQMALYDLQMQFLQNKLLALQSAGQGETAEAQKIATQIVETEKQKNNQLIENEKRTSDLKKSLRQAEFQMANDFLQLGIDLLGADEDARKEHAGAIKAFTIAQIGVGLAREIQGIWENANKNPINALIPGWGTGFAIFQTGLAGARAAFQVRKVANEKFADGGAFNFRRLFAADGGVLRRDGVLPGDTSHRQGGLSVYDNRSGRQVAEFESQEGVIFSKNALKNNPHLWEPLLYSSQYLKGAPVYPRFAEGGTMGEVARLPTSGNALGQTSNSMEALVLEMAMTRQAVQVMTEVFLANQDKFREVNISLLPFIEEMDKVKFRQKENSN